MGLPRGERGQSRYREVVHRVYQRSTFGVIQIVLSYKDREQSSPPDPEQSFYIYQGGSAEEEIQKNNKDEVILGTEISSPKADTYSI